MRENEYDAIVVGARRAGSPTAMLLARKGYKVLVADRARFPSDTISTHLIHPPGVAALKEWGLLDRLIATGCPGIDTYAFDLGPLTIAGAPGTDEARWPTPRDAPCSTSCWWMRRQPREPSSAGVHAHGCRVRGRARQRHPRAPEGRTGRHRGRPGGRRRGRSPLACGTLRQCGGVQREAAASGQLLHLPERLPMDGATRSTFAPTEGLPPGPRTTA